MNKVRSVFFRMSTQLVFFVTAGLSGCVGVGKKEPVPLPAAMESYFRICSPLDGALVMQVFNAGDLLGSAEMDWSSDEKGWKIDLSNAAGFNIASLTQNGNTLKTTGSQAKKMPAMSVDGEGFLNIDGNFVGIKSKEIPCLLHGALPRSWTPLIFAVEGHQDKRIKISIGDDQRDIIVRTRHLGDSKSEEICAEISWRNKLIFSSTVKWCVSGAGLKKGEITGIKDYSVKWVRFDG
jgi:hypothetical protein